MIKEYDHESIRPIPSSDCLPLEEVDKTENIKPKESMLIKRRPAKTKQKKTENVITIDRELIIVKPDDHVPPCTELAGLVFGVVEDKHLIMYSMNAFELIDLTEKSSNS